MHALALLALLAATAGLASCDAPNRPVQVGYPGYRTLPPGDAVSWPSSGQSNGAGCVPPQGERHRCQEQQ